MILVVVVDSMTADVVDVVMDVIVVEDDGGRWSHRDFTNISFISNK